MPAAALQVDDELPIVAYVIGSTPSTGPFAVPFPLPTSYTTTLKVAIDGVETADWTFTPDSDVAGGYPSGEVTLTYAQSNKTITIWRRMPLQRTTDFGNGPLDMAGLNSELAYVIMRLQDIKLRAGMIWHVGSGVPASSLGADGDMYINTANGDLYGPKNNGAWGSAVASLKGAQGNPGDMSGVNNLSELTNVATARTNLSVYSIAQVDAAIDADIAAHVALADPHAQYQLESDYTAADVLAKLLTVDGAGSGLDADRLDGISSADFAQLAVANTFTANQTISKASAAQTLNASSGDANYYIRAVSGAAAAQRFQTATLDRWLVGGDASAESGSNAGRAFVIYAYDDAGAFLRTQLSINRATGVATFGGAILAQPGSLSAPGLAFPADSNSGIHWFSDNFWALVSNGTSVLDLFSSYVQSKVRHIFPNGAVGSVGVGLNGGSTNGFYSIGTNNPGAAANGALVWQWDTGGVKDASANIWQVGGKHLLPLPAAAWRAQTTNGAAWYSAELATNKQMVQGWAFDAATDEFIQLSMPMPKSWNEGTFTARLRWYAPSGTGNVVWGVQALCVGDDDALDAAWGTAVTVTDAITATGDMMVTAETGAITAAGSPAEADTLWLRVYRDANNGSDTFSADAVLLEVELFPALNGANDA